MIICVEGSKQFNDYDIFMRAMGVALSGLKGNQVEVWSVGPHKVNSFTAAFCNSSENFLKANGIKIKFYKVDPRFVSANMQKIDYYAYMCRPNEAVSHLTAKADADNIEVGIFRY